jgi:hypothetical protein
MLVPKKNVYVHLPAQMDCQKFSRVSPSPGNLHDRPVMAMDSWSAILVTLSVFEKKKNNNFSCALKTNVDDGPGNLGMIELIRAR